MKTATATIIALAALVTAPATVPAQLSQPLKLDGIKGETVDDAHTKTINFL